MTRSKGAQARSRTRVRCRASAQGSRAVPTELNGAPDEAYLVDMGGCLWHTFALAVLEQVELWPTTMLPQ